MYSETFLKPNEVLGNERISTQDLHEILPQIGYHNMNRPKNFYKVEIWW